MTERRGEKTLVGLVVEMGEFLGMVPLTVEQQHCQWLGFRFVILIETASNVDLSVSMMAKTFRCLNNCQRCERASMMVESGI
jgi:hypothetical protein